jgi:hypothetical protein
MGFTRFQNAIAFPRFYAGWYTLASVMGRGLFEVGSSPKGITRVTLEWGI